MTLFATHSSHDQAGYFPKSHFHDFTVSTNDTRNVIRAIEHGFSQLSQEGIRDLRWGVEWVD